MALVTSDDFSGTLNALVHAIGGIISRMPEEDRNAVLADLRDRNEWEQTKSPPSKLTEHGTKIGFNVTVEAIEYIAMNPESDNIIRLYVGMSADDSDEGGD